MRRKRKKQGDVELNLAAMLDMAFQLLTFFILTFKPAPIEGQFSLRLPPPEPITKAQNAQKAGSDDQNNNPVLGMDSLVVSIFSDSAGNIATLALGEQGVGSLAMLESKLKYTLGDPNSPFDRVVIQVGAKLRYEELMRVVDLCTRQTLADGKKLGQLSFIELPGAPGAAP